eukprot:Clim_evm15s216 gene=Clim_evmTU15s216
MRELTPQAQVFRISEENIRDSKSQQLHVSNASNATEQSVQNAREEVVHSLQMAGQRSSNNRRRRSATVSAGQPPTLIPTTPRSMEKETKVQNKQSVAVAAIVSPRMHHAQQSPRQNPKIAYGSPAPQEAQTNSPSSLLAQAPRKGRARASTVNSLKAPRLSDLNCPEGPTGLGSNRLPGGSNSARVPNLFSRLGTRSRSNSANRSSAIGAAVATAIDFDGLATRQALTAEGTLPLEDVPAVDPNDAEVYLHTMHPSHKAVLKRLGLTKIELLTGAPVGPVQPQKKGRSRSFSLTGRSNSGTPAEIAAMLQASPPISLSEHAVFGKPLTAISVDSEAERTNSGRSLLSLTQDQCPVFFSKLVAFIKANGMKSEGLFRLSGSITRIKAIKSQFDSGDYTLDKDVVQPHDATGTLKMWLREMPEPLLGSEARLAWLAAGRLQEKSSRLAAYRSLLSLLPICHLDVLYVLLELMEYTAAHQGTKMTGYNLAVCMAPNILRGTDGISIEVPKTSKGETVMDRTMDEGAATVQVVQELIENRVFLYQVEQSSLIWLSNQLDKAKLMDGSGFSPRPLDGTDGSKIRKSIA